MEVRSSTASKRSFGRANEEPGRSNGAEKNSPKKQRTSSSATLNQTSKQQATGNLSSQALEKTNLQSSLESSKDQDYPSGGNSTADKSEPPDERELVLVSNLKHGLSRMQLQVKVTRRSEMRIWSTATKRHYVFNADLEDSTGDVRLVAFDDECQNFFRCFEVGSTVSIKTFNCRFCDQRFKSTSGKFEIVLNEQSSVQPCHEIIELPPKIPENYNSLVSVSRQTADDSVNVCGILLRNEGLIQFNRKSDGKPSCRRELELIDEMQVPVKVTLWNNTAISFSEPEASVLFVKRGRIKVYGGCHSISITPMSQLESDLSHPRTKDLKEWWRKAKNEIMDLEAPGPSDQRNSDLTFAAALKLSDVAKQHQDRAPICFWNTIKIITLNTDGLVYKGCTSPTCTKKVEITPEKTWFCSKCNQKTSTFKWHASIKMVVRDVGMDIKCIGFDSIVMKLLGVDSEALASTIETDSDELERLLALPLEKTLKMKFACRRNINDADPTPSFIVLDLEDI